MVQFTVTTANDVVDLNDGRLSLREAVAQANATAAADTIVFSSSLAGQSIVLAAGQLTITRDLTIDGNANGGLGVTIDAQHASRALQISSGAKQVNIDHITITGGNSHGADGGGIVLGSNADLGLTDSTI